MDDDVDKHPDAGDEPVPSRVLILEEPWTGTSYLHKSGTTTPMVGNEGGTIIDNHQPNPERRNSVLASVSRRCLGSKVACVVLPPRRFRAFAPPSGLHPIFSTTNGR